jgi:hypothetical protein
MKLFRILLLLFFFVAIKAQNVIPSNTYVRTCLNDVECASINSSSQLFYDDTKAKFYMKIDFNAMKTGVDSVDFWLQDLDDTYFYFKSSLPKEEFPNISDYNAKVIRMNGQAFLNNIWRDMNIDMSIYRAEHDLLSNTNNENQFDSYKVNFSFSFSPKDFNLHKKPQRLTNIIFIGVGGGQINLLKPGMEGQVGDAYLK